MDLRLEKRSSLSTVKDVCASDFSQVFEPVQQLLSLDLNSWANSKTSQKTPTQSAFPEISKQINRHFPIKVLKKNLKIL